MHEGLGCVVCADVMWGIPGFTTVWGPFLGTLNIGLRNTTGTSKGGSI